MTTAGTRTPDTADLNTYPTSVVFPSALPNCTRSGIARSRVACATSNLGAAASAAITISADEGSNTHGSWDKSALDLARRHVRGRAITPSLRQAVVEHALIVHGVGKPNPAANQDCQQHQKHHIAHPPVRLAFRRSACGPLLLLIHDDQRKRISLLSLPWSLSPPSPTASGRKASAET